MELLILEIHLILLHQSLHVCLLDTHLFLIQGRRQSGVAVGLRLRDGVVVLHLGVRHLLFQVCVGLRFRCAQFVQVILQGYVAGQLGLAARAGVQTSRRRILIEVTSCQLTGPCRLVPGVLIPGVHTLPRPVDCIDVLLVGVVNLRQSGPLLRRIHLLQIVGIVLNLRKLRRCQSTRAAAPSTCNRVKADVPPVLVQQAGQILVFLLQPLLFLVAGPPPGI